MKKIILLLTLLVSSRVFSQSIPTTTPPVAPQQLNTAAWYQEPSTRKIFVYNGSTYLWRQMTDSAQVARMIANLGTTVTASNGLTKVGSNIKLGGSLTESTSIIVDDAPLFVRTNDEHSELLVSNGAVNVYAGNTDGIIDGAYGSFYADASNSIFGRTTVVSGVTKTQQINLSGTQMVIVDDLNNKGPVFINNYNAAQLSDDRAITDVGGVRSLIATAGSGYAKLSGGNNFTESQNISGGNLTVTDGLLYVRQTGTNKYVYADATTINAVNPDNSDAIILNGNSSTLQWNLGSIIGTIHADNILSNQVWQMPNASGNVVVDTQLPGGAIGGGIAHVTDKAALQAFTGAETTILATDSLFGKVINTFNYYPSATNYDGGIVIQAIGKGSGAWVRAYNGNGFVYPEWWGAKPFYPQTQTNTTGFDSRAAIQAAIDYIPHRNTTVQLASNYLVKDSLQVGEGTKIIGLNRLIPNQLDSTSHFPLVDTIKYKSQTALHFLNNTNGIVTTLDAVPYRNQGIVLKDFAIFGTGKTNGKTLVLLRLNPNSTSALTKPGLFYLENMSLGNSSTLADGRGVSDSWYVRNSCHFMNAVYGLRTGTSNTWVDHNDFYNCTIGAESNARYDNFSFNEFEGDKSAGQLGLLINGTDGTFNNNTISNLYDGFKASSTSARANIHNNVMQASRYDYIDSLSTSNRFAGNFIYSGLNTIVGQIPVKLKKNSHFVMDGNTFITGSANSTVPAEIDTCTSFVAINNKFQNYVLPDARAMLFVGTNTFSRITDYANRFMSGTVTFGNNIGGSGIVDIVGDNDVTNSTFERVASGASTARSNFTTYTKYGGTIAAPTALPNGSIIMANQFRGYTGSALSGTSILERLEARSVWSATSTGTKFVWSAIPGGSTTKIDVMNLTSSGAKIGDTTKSTALLHIAAGTTAAGTAPLKFTSGTNLTTAEAGAIEFDGTDLFYTTSALTRRTVVNLAAAQTLTNKTLTSPQINTPLLNTTSVVGQVWTATNTAGAGNWATAPSFTDNTLSKTADYTIVAGDFAAGKKTTLDLYVDATAGNVIITLPSAATFAGYTIYITKTDASANTITVNTLLGGNSITSQYQVKQCNSNSGSWYNH